MPMPNPESAVPPSAVKAAETAARRRGVARRHPGDENDASDSAAATGGETCAESQPPAASDGRTPDAPESPLVGETSRDDCEAGTAVAAASDGSTEKSVAAMVAWLVGATLTAGSATFLAGGADRGGSLPPKPDPLPEPRPDPLPKPKPDPMPDPKPEPKPDPQPDPTPPHVDPKPDPAPDPTPPHVDPKPDPVPDPTPPHVDPKPDPVPDPTPPQDIVPPTAPTIHLLHDTGVPGDLVTNDARVQVSDLEAGAVWESSRDGKTWTARTGDTIDASEFAGDGDKRVQVRQIDAAGNLSPEATLSFRLDTTITDPTATLRSEARENYPLANDVDFHSGTVVNRATWIQLGLEDRAHWTYSINGGQDYVPGDGDRLDLDVLKGEGVQELRIRQQDEAGNWSRDTVLELTVDNTSPVVTATFSPEIPTPPGVPGKYQSYDFQADEEAQIVFVPIGAVHGETPQSYLAGWHGKGFLVAAEQTSGRGIWREQPVNAMYTVLAVDKAGNVSFVPMSGGDGAAGTSPAAVALRADGMFAGNRVVTAAPDPLDGRSIARSSGMADHFFGSDRADVFSWNDHPEAMRPQIDWIHGYSKAQGDVIDLARVPADGRSMGTLGDYLRKEVLADGTLSLWIDYDGKGETFPGNFDQQILVTSQSGTDLLLRLGQNGAPVVI
jgi:hypothetical protein